MKEVIMAYLAQTGLGRPGEGLLNGPQTPKSLLGELGPLAIVLGAALLVGLIVFLAVYWWKRGAADGGEAVAGAGDHHGHRHGKRRKRLRAHRPRNPTLAETGGLPPLRDEGPPPSQP